jgi:thiol-disulfide isomerase/thioredoxin
MSEANRAPRAGWQHAALVVIVVALLFGGVVLPYLRPARSPNLGKLAPDFTLPVVHGGEPGNRLHLADLRGNAVLLDFWASWCAPCRQQAPIVDRVARRWEGKGVVVVGVNTGDEQDEAVRFAASRKLSYASVFDDGRVAEAYGVRQMPTLYVLGPDGRVVAVRQRVVGERELEELVKEALGAGSAG